MAIKRLYGESDDTYNKRNSMTGYNRYIKELFADLRKANEGTSLTEEAKDMLNCMDELQQLWDKALVGAVQNFQSNRVIKKSTNKNGGGKYQRRLKEKDLVEYLKAGGRKNKSKQIAIESGKKIILTSKAEITEYIDKAIDKQVDEVTVAYGKVCNNLAEDVFEYSDGKIDVQDNFLEFVPNDLQHAYSQHHIAKENGDINLSREDFENIPDYLDSYELVYAIKYGSGNTRICVSKKLSDGRMLIIETLSKSRGAIQFKNAIGVSEEKYINEFRNRYKKTVRIPEEVITSISLCLTILFLTTEYHKNLLLSIRSIRKIPKKIPQNSPFGERR